MVMAGHGRHGGSQDIRLISLKRIYGNTYEAEIETENGEIIRLQVRVENDIVETPFGSYHLSIAQQSSEDSSASTSTGGSANTSWLVEFDEHSGELRARLSMKVVELLKKVGDKVSQNDKIAVVETMKILNEVYAPCSGELVEAVEPGKGVAPGEPIAKIRCRDKQHA
jgi:biotin carboxyl carrier protein